MSTGLSPAFNTRKLMPPPMAMSSPDMDHFTSASALGLSPVLPSRMKASRPSSSRLTSPPPPNLHTLFSTGTAVPSTPKSLALDPAGIRATEAISAHCRKFIDPPSKVSVLSCLGYHDNHSHLRFGNIED